jgi:hypothetical protein
LTNLYRLSFMSVLVLLSLLACDRVVNSNPNQDVAYVITGDVGSTLFPIELKKDGEDVRIRLLKSAPMPEIVSIDPDGHAVPFNFKIDGDTLVVPGKFDHIALHHAGTGTIDITKKSTVH